MFDITAARRAILNHALQQLKLSAGDSDFDISTMLDLLPRGGGNGRLRRILTALKQPPDKPQPPGLRQCLQPLDNLQAFLLGQQSDDDAKALVRLLHQSAQVLEQQDLADRRVFDRWMVVLRRAVSSLPSQRGEELVSLYHETKMLSAVTHASRGSADADMLLIEGDFPGIQAMIYAIDVKGATKNVRGRSFFLQLLIDTIVQRLLADFDLPQSNALYVAGGKFLLLAPPDETGVVASLQAQVNQTLLAQFQGVMRFVLVAEPIHTREIGTAEDFQAARERLKARLGRAKTQPFQGIVADDPATLFTPTYDEDLRRLVAREDSEFNQDVFAQLANRLAHLQHDDVQLVFSKQRLAGEDRYSSFLRELCGIGCQIQLVGTSVPDDAYVVRLNDTHFDLSIEHGFRMLALHTPIITEADVRYWRDRDQHTNDEEEEIYEGAIRTFDLLASQARKSNRFKRYGVLRMDVDNLGNIFSSQLGAGDQASVTETIAASDAMSLFFEAYMPQICREVEEQSKRLNSLYLIYGGGDDLFVVGEWDMLPVLAGVIHERFAQYTDNQASISAGIVLQTARFPFYQAARLAGVALDERAKERPGKNAICFFDHIFGWDEWTQVVAQQEKMHKLAEHMASNTVIRRVMDLYTQWHTSSSQQDQTGAIRFGRYQWQSAYQIARLKQQYKDSSADIDEVQQTMLQPDTIRFAGTAALWAELRRRTRDSKQD